MFLSSFLDNFLNFGLVFPIGFGFIFLIFVYIFSLAASFLAMNNLVQHFSRSHSPTFDDIGKAVHFHLLNLDSYSHEDINVKVRQSVNLNNPLGVIDEAYYCPMTVLLRNYRYDNAGAIMTVHFSHVFNSAGATYADVVHNIQDEKLLIRGQCIVTIDGYHSRRSVKLLSNEDVVS